MEYTPQELMVVCAARQIQDGEHVFVGMRLPLLAFALAKRTHAPHCVAYLRLVSCVIHLRRNCSTRWGMRRMCVGLNGQPALSK